MLMIGLSLLFYPDIASWWNGRSQRSIVVSYDEDVARLSRELIELQFQRAAEVNASLGNGGGSGPMLLAHLAIASLPHDYRDILNVNGVMGRLTIPVVGIDMPIFHGTGSDALDRGVGHMEGTAFPIGGYGTHSVLTAHTGLPNARMFNNLERHVHPGDKFFINVLGQTFAYEVFDAYRIYPWETESMRIIPGEDLVTLMTCTPYGINSHRWLVRGRRTEYIPYMAEDIVQTISVAARENDIRIFIFVGLFLLFMVVFAIYNATKSKNNPIPRRRRARPAMPEPAVIGNQDRYIGNRSVINDMFSNLESQPPPAPYVINAQPTNANDYNSRLSTKPLKPALIGRNAPGNRKSARKQMLKSNMTRNIAACFIAFLIVVGIGVAVAQAIGQPSRNGGHATMTDFVTRMESHNDEHRDRWVAAQLARWMEGDLSILDEGTPESLLSQLHSQVTAHNRQLYESGQGSLPDPFTYSQDSLNLSHFGFEDEEMIGFIAIPSADIELPIFLGASRENLHRGLAHVTNTSLPIGGVNTNTVIAGHMDLRRASLLDNIDEVSIGDEIHITNFYETITYVITYINNNAPAPAETLTIQSGQDILTLLGYRQGTAERYTVVARRTN